MVFTLPEPIAAIAFYNKKAVYDFSSALRATLLTIARDPKRLGVELGFFAVLHSWGQNLHFHPHLHCVVPGGGSAPTRTAGFTAAAGTCCPSGCSAVCSAACFWKPWKRPTPPPTPVLWRSGIPPRTARLRRLSGAVAQVRMGGVRQAALRRAATRAGIPGTLYPSCGHLQPPPVDVGTRPSFLRLERLPGQAATSKSDDCFRRRVHPALPAALPSAGLPTHPLLRLASQLPPRRKTGPLPPVAGHAPLRPVAPAHRLPHLWRGAHRQPTQAMPQVPRRNSHLHSFPAALLWAGSSAPGQLMMLPRRNPRPRQRCLPGRASHPSVRRGPQALRTCMRTSSFPSPSPYPPTTSNPRLSKRPRRSAKTSRPSFARIAAPDPISEQNPLKTWPQSGV